VLPLTAGCQINFSTVGTWSVETPPPVPITTNSVVPLPDGRVAIFGGFAPATGRALTQTMLFDPLANNWMVGAPMPGPLRPDVVVALHDGTVLVEGGQGGDGPSGDTWLYDAGSNSWSRAGSLHTARAHSSFAILTDGRVLVEGGSRPLSQPIQLANGNTLSYQAVDSAEIFDPATKTWSPAGRLNSARSYVALVALPHGMALAAGGCRGGLDAGGASLTVAELFDPSTKAWSPTTPLPEPRCGASGVPLPDGRALLVGGDLGPTFTAVAFDSRSHRWALAGTILPGDSSPILLADGRVMLSNMQTSPVQGRVGTAFVGGQIFDPKSGDWNFATTTSVLIPSNFLQGGSSTPVALPNGDAIVLLQTVALDFHPAVAPPTRQVLDSAGLTLVLLLMLGLLVLLLAVGYMHDVSPHSDSVVSRQQSGSSSDNRF
jgi:Galactose oxidase, central domain/Kelch motif